MDLDKMTFGYELELGDVTRSRKLPKWLGEWEYAECDILNLHGNYAGLACDPRGEEPPIGGEVNVLPATSAHGLAHTVNEGIRWFTMMGDKPSASSINHGHVHVRVPGLRDDIDALKRLTRYIAKWQGPVIQNCYGYKSYDTMEDSKATKAVRSYLKWDGGRPMPEWMADNIVNMAEDFDDFIRIQCCGKDGVSRGRPFRYAVNTYCLKHTDTIEFRCFRASTDPDRILGSIMFAEDFIRKALTDQEPPKFDFPFPMFYWSKWEAEAWYKTKWGKERGTKVRRLIDV